MVSKLIAIMQTHCKIFITRIPCEIIFINFYMKITPHSNYIGIFIIINKTWAIFKCTFILKICLIKEFWHFFKPGWYKLSGVLYWLYFCQPRNNTPPFNFAIILTHVSTLAVL